MHARDLLITGSNGFLGSEIVSQALRQVKKVRTIDVKQSLSISGIRHHRLDITKSQNELLTAFQGVSTVVHAAGLAHVFKTDRFDCKMFSNINIDGTKNIAITSAEAGVSHFILISSVSVYGPHTNGIYSEDMPCRPVGAYAKSKYQAELVAKEIALKTNMNLTILRLTPLYGEGDPGNVGRLIKNLDKGQFVWIGTGKNLKSLIHKEDAARACLTIATRPSFIGVREYNVSAPPITMLNIVDVISKALGKKPLPGRIPASIATSACRLLSYLPSNRLSGLNTTVEKWLADDVYDTKRIETDYSFHSKVNIKDGLKRQVQWYQQMEKREIS